MPSPERELTRGRALAWAKTRAVTLTSLAAIGLAVMCVVAWLPVWPCTLFEHFYLQYVEVGLVVVVAAAALRVRGYFDIALIATLFHALPIVADLTARPTALPPTGVPLRVLLLNVHTESSGFEQVRQLIADENPDVIGLVEVDRRWLDALAPALASYPGRIESPRTDNLGIALYARGAVTGDAIELGSPFPTIVAELAVRDARFSVILTHPLPPVRSVLLDQQRVQLDAVAERARSIAGPVLVMGDFNATPWSRAFARLRDRTGLCDSRASFGVQASFPASSALLRIPIDHVLASCSVGVRDRRIGRDVGSDHLPVIVDLLFAR